MTDWDWQKAIDSALAAGRRPEPAALWYAAQAEYPGDDNADARVARYGELMREHGHIVPGTPQPLPCGWQGGKPAYTIPAGMNTSEALERLLNGADPFDWGYPTSMEE